MGNCESLELPSDVFQHTFTVTLNSDKSYTWRKKHVEENCYDKNYIHLHNPTKISIMGNS